MTDTMPEPPVGATRRTLAAGRVDLLVQEEPLLLVVHGQQLLTMRTPGRDQDLAIGFLLGEGIIQAAGDVQEFEARPAKPDGRTAEELHLTLARAPGELARSRLARTHEIRSSCGVCGLADAQSILEGLPPLLPGVPQLPVARIDDLVSALQSRQELFAATGGCHGALIANATGDVVAVAEDVGRHNALDKAIGAAARAGAALSRCVAVLSGRAGYDLVTKCLRVRIPIVISVSAPSALAFDLCETAGATLVGFARQGRHSVYCGAGRLR